jgi:hypothetical protein
MVVPNIPPALKVHILIYVFTKFLQASNMQLRKYCEDLLLFVPVLVVYNKLSLVDFE